MADPNAEEGEVVAVAVEERESQAEGSSQVEQSQAQVGESQVEESQAAAAAADDCDSDKDDIEADDAIVKPIVVVENILAVNDSKVPLEPVSTQQLDPDSLLDGDNDKANYLKIEMTSSSKSMSWLTKALGQHRHWHRFKCGLSQQPLVQEIHRAIKAKKTKKINDSKWDKAVIVIKVRGKILCVQNCTRGVHLCFRNYFDFDNSILSSKDLSILQWFIEQLGTDLNKQIISDDVEPLENLRKRPASALQDEEDHGGDSRNASSSQQPQPQNPPDTRSSGHDSGNTSSSESGKDDDEPPQSVFNDQAQEEEVQTAFLAKRARTCRRTKDGQSKNSNEIEEHLDQILKHPCCQNVHWSKTKYAFVLQVKGEKKQKVFAAKMGTLRKYILGKRRYENQAAENRTHMELQAKIESAAHEAMAHLAQQATREIP